MNLDINLFENSPLLVDGDPAGHFASTSQFVWHLVLLLLLQLARPEIVAVRRVGLVRQVARVGWKLTVVTVYLLRSVGAARACSALAHVVAGGRR